MEDESDKQSDSDNSICVIDVVNKPPEKKRKEVTFDKDNLVKKQKARLGKAMAVFEKHHKKAKKSSEEPSLKEEDAYKRKVKWLRDHGDSDSDEKGVSSEQTNESD